MRAGRKGEPVREAEQLTYELKCHVDVEYTQRAFRFMDEQAQADRPFLLYFNHSLMHIPVVPRDEYRGRSGNGDWADSLLQLDGTSVYSSTIDKRRGTRRTCIMTKRPLFLLIAVAILVVTVAAPATARPREFRIGGGDICGEMGIYGTKPFSPIPAYGDGPRISRVFFSGTSGPCGEFRFSLEITDKNGDDVSGTDDDAIDQGMVEIYVPGIPLGGFTITRKALRDVGFVGFVTGSGYSRWEPDQAFLLDAVLDPATGTLTLI